VNLRVRVCRHFVALQRVSQSSSLERPGQNCCLVNVYLSSSPIERCRVTIDSRWNAQFILFSFFFFCYFTVVRVDICVNGDAHPKKARHNSELEQNNRYSVNKAGFEVLEELTLMHVVSLRKQNERQTPSNYRTFTKFEFCHI